MAAMANILLAEDEPTNAQMAAFICRRLGHQWAGLPVIGLTALSGRDDQAAMLAAGMVRVITKPCRAKDIEEAIVAVLGQGADA
jgi:CheY-like chemotaxis protein